MNVTVEEEGDRKIGEVKFIEAKVKGSRVALLQPGDFGGGRPEETVNPFWALGAEGNSKQRRLKQEILKEATRALASAETRVGLSTRDQKASLV